MDVLQSIVIGCANKGVVRKDQLDVLSGLSLPREPLNESQYLENPTMDGIEELCSRILSDFENQEALVDRIIKVFIEDNCQH